MKNNILPLSQAKIKSIKKLNQKKYRYETNTYICEGLRLFNTATTLKCKNIYEVIVNQNFINSDHFTTVLFFCEKNKIPVFSCEDRIYKSLSAEKSPVGLMFVMSLKYYQESDLSNLISHNCVYLENISNPGNLGTIIRTAAWYGFEDIFLSSGSVDPFNPKVVRSTAGGIFKVKLYLNIELENILAFGTEKNYELIGTAADGNVSLDNWHVSDKNIIFFGGEASGLTIAAKKILNKNIRILGTGEMESLNLAVTAGIVFNQIYKVSNLKMKL